MSNPSSFLNVLNGTETTQSLLLGAGCTIGGRPVPGGGAAVVATTATTLTLSAATHANKRVSVKSAAPIAITLPAATGTGDKYELYIEVAATATAHTIVTQSGETLQGVAWGATTSTENAIGWVASAASTTISLNGTTKGGVVGDKIELVDIGTSLWNVQAFTAPTGAVATPFS